MRPRSWPRGPLAAALAMLCASTGFAIAQVRPPDWEPGCSPVPRGCVAGSGALKLDLARRALAWTWTGGGLVSVSDVANPTLEDRYDLCVYDGSHTLVLAAGVPPAGICAGRPCWKARPWGFLYRDRGGSTAGFTKIQLRVASRRHDKLLVQAAGSALAMPSATPVPPLIVQLVRTHAPTLMPVICWTSSQTKSRAPTKHFRSLSDKPRRN